ncbi:MAG: hypothetical protein U9R39_09440 [Campylobacterota bacterium]|nr:hypothetical protein [Campylobacterota bacterium]
MTKQEKQNIKDTLIKLLSIEINTMPITPKLLESNNLEQKLNILLSKSIKSLNKQLSNKQKEQIQTKRTEFSTKALMSESFTISDTMISFAEQNNIKDINRIFESFKNYYIIKAIEHNDWEELWKRWVSNQKGFKNNSIDIDMELDDVLRLMAKNYIAKKDLEEEFKRFKNHYLAKGYEKSSWANMWQNWCIRYKQFKPKHKSKKQIEKEEYRWDFIKAKESSDKIKDWLEFEKGINWLDDYYWKNIPIPYIGWQKVKHPDFDKEEILLYKLDSEYGKILLNNKSDDIIDIEVLS